MTDDTKKKKILIIIAVVLCLVAAAVVTITILDPFHPDNGKEEQAAEPEPTKYVMSEASKRLHEIYNAAYNYAYEEDRMETSLVYDEAWLTDPDPSVVNAAEDGLADGSSAREHVNTVIDDNEKYRQYYNAAYNYAYGENKLETPLTYDEAWLTDPDETIAKASKEGLQSGTEDKQLYDELMDAFSSD